MRKFEHRLVVGLSILLALLTIFGGFSAIISPLTPMDGALGFIYASRIGLVTFGSIVIACGLTLVYGLIKKSRKWTSRGIMAIFCSFLFATFLQAAAFQWVPAYWVPNGIFAIISALMWVRWKMKTEYIDKKQFLKDIQELEN